MKTQTSDRTPPTFKKPQYNIHPSTSDNLIYQLLNTKVLSILENMKGLYKAAVLLSCILGQLTAGAPIEEQSDSSALTSPNKDRKSAEIRVGESTRRVAYFLDSAQNAIM